MTESGSFVLTKDEREGVQYPLMWKIPVCYACGGGKQIKIYGYCNGVSHVFIYLVGWEVSFAALRKH